MSQYIHFTLPERRIIARWKSAKSLRWIAVKLGRSVSSISDEVARNSVRGRYIPHKAEHKAYVARRESKLQCLKVAMEPKLKQYVIDAITDDQSPEGISGRLKRIVRELPYASTKAIYKFVLSPHGRKIEKHLHSKAVKKRGGPKRNTPVTVDGRTMIDKRPADVETRLEFGHYEGDFIESGKDGTGSLLVLVERKTRYPFLLYLEDRTTFGVNTAVQQLLKDSPIQSLTIDNDISFQKHKELSKLLHAAVFFCHPRAPHEKGTVENRNKAIRRYVPKRSDLASFSQEHFAMVEQKLRDRYMKCLGYKTPREAFLEEVNKLHTKKPRLRGMLNPILLTR